MKKALLLAVGVFLMSMASAQSLKFGVKAGFNYTNIDAPSDISGITWDSESGYHVGLVLQVKLPAGLALQPELQFSTKDAKVKDNTISETFSAGYLQLPVNLQWGFDLEVARPFLQAGPYVG